jgi:hypothetical protein
MMCVRATPAYITLVLRLRSDASSDVPIQFCVKAATVSFRSREGCPPSTRLRIPAALARASCAVSP